MSKLAIFNGPKIRTKLFPRQISINEQEEQAVLKVMKSKLLSGYRGNWGSYFMGGPEVKAFEKEFADKFGSSYCIAVNSCTSALYVACGCIGLEPGTMCAVVPWSMSCSSSSPLLHGSVPYFIDLDSGFAMSPLDLKKKMNQKIKGIIVVDLFGMIADYRFLEKIANSYNIPIICDCAQAPGSYLQYKDKTKKYAGNFGDIGVFSFTMGKHMSGLGEGGCLLTNNSDYAKRAQLIRNHFESVIHSMPNDEVRNRVADGMDRNAVGMNLRMLEVQAATLRIQLKKLDSFIQLRQENATYFNKYIPEVCPCISNYPIREDCSHSYYVLPLKFDSSKCDGIHRNSFIDAVAAELSLEEGRPDKTLFGKGYCEPIQNFPLFQRKKMYGNSYFPFDHNKEIWNLIQDNYTLESTPYCTHLWKNELALMMHHNLPLTDNDREDIVNAFSKVYKNRSGLKIK